MFSFQENNLGNPTMILVSVHNLDLRNVKSVSDFFIKLLVCVNYLHDRLAATLVGANLIFFI